jgi:uncharacterized protein
MDPELPLDEDELDELDDFLRSEAVGEDAMDVSMLDGFLTALAVGPTNLPPALWLPMIWGKGATGRPRKLPSACACWCCATPMACCCSCARNPMTSIPCSGSASMTAARVGHRANGASASCSGMALDEVSWKPLLDRTTPTTYLLDIILLHGTEHGMQQLENDPTLDDDLDDHVEAMLGNARRADGLLAAAAQACLDPAPRGAQGRAQRRLPLRQRQEVQEVLRRRRPPALITSRHCPPLRQGPWPARGRRGCAPARRAHGPGARHRTGASGRSCGRCARPPAGSSPAAR